VFINKYGMQLNATTNATKFRRSGPKATQNARVNACTHSPTPQQAICTGGVVSAGARGTSKLQDFELT